MLHSTILKHSKKGKRINKKTPKIKKETDKHASTNWQSKIEKHLKLKTNRNEAKKKIENLH